MVIITKDSFKDPDFIVAVYGYDPNYYYATKYLMRASNGELRVNSKGKVVRVKETDVIIAI